MGGAGFSMAWGGGGGQFVPHFLTPPVGWLGYKFSNFIIILLKGNINDYLGGKKGQYLENWPRYYNIWTLHAGYQGLEMYPRSRLAMWKSWPWEPTPRVKILTLGAGSQSQNFDLGSRLLGSFLTPGSRHVESRYCNISANFQDIDLVFFLDSH